MKKVLKTFLFVFLLANLFIVLSGKKWLYKAVSITYFKGYISSYIDDFIYFPANIIQNGKHQEWLVSKKYNQKYLSKDAINIHEELETVSFLVIINDSIRFEKYWHGYSSDKMSNSYSISKSWVSTLVGIAIKDKKIKSIDQLVSSFLPSFCNGKDSLITIKNLLTMSSGLNWKEDYYNPIGQAAQAYYGNNLKELVLNLNPVEIPGKIFDYNSACTQILAFVIENATGKTISEYASEKLWQPMGAKHPALWSKDTEGGDEKAFCCINSNARDFARLGKLYLNLGNWNGTQILDTSYIVNSTLFSDLKDRNGKENKKYGYQYWITNYKNMPVYYARGLLGQYIICIPAKDMIIVRLGRKNGALLNNGHYEDLYMFIDAALEI